MYYKFFCIVLLISTVYTQNIFSQSLKRSDDTNKINDNTCFRVSVLSGISGKGYFTAGLGTQLYFSRHFTLQTEYFNQFSYQQTSFLTIMPQYKINLSRNRINFFIGAGGVVGIGKDGGGFSVIGSLQTQYNFTNIFSTGLDIKCMAFVLRPISAYIYLRINLGLILERL